MFLCLAAATVNEKKHMENAGRQNRMNTLQQEKVEWMLLTFSLW